MLRLLFLVSCCAIASPAVAAKPSFTELRMNAYDLSADGTVVVGRVAHPDHYSAVRWSATTGLVELPQIPGEMQFAAWSTSGDGQVIAGTSDLNGTNSFRWLPESGSSPFEVSRPRDISVDGSIIVGDKNGLPVRWTLETGATPLWDISERTRGIAMSISADNSTVVGAFELQPFRWTEATGRQNLGTPFSSNRSFVAEDVSDNGSVLLIAELGRSPGPSHFWSETNGFELITSEREFYAGAMSDNARIVVGATHDLGASIWTASRGIVSVEQMLLDAGLSEELNGWDLQSANFTSARGNVIVGQGTNPNGEYVSWIATVPEPPSALLLAIGGIVLLRNWTRRPQATA